MQLIDDRHRTAGKLAAFLQKTCLWLLIGCYGLAVILPGPGRDMRDWQWGESGTPGTAVTLPLLLLTLLLFCAALLTKVSQIRVVSARPWALLTGIVTVWLVPAVLVVAAAAAVPRLIDAPASAEILVGLALVASMPVANSSVGWTQTAGGNLALALALVLVTIFLCPWITPALLAALRFSLALPERASVQTLVDNFSGTFFIAWVVLPTALGLACRFMLGERRVSAAAPSIAIVSVAALLLLNYVNAAIAFPEVFEQTRLSVIALTAALAVALSVVGLAAGWLIARLMRLAPDERSALLFGLSMKHTGLALLLAGAMLADQRLAILMIVLATLAQHLAAGVVEWRMQRSRLVEEGRGVERL